MKIIGIHDGHNGSCALVEDGKLILAVQEERFINVKNAAGFPKNALQYLLKETGTKLSDIDHFAIHSEHMPTTRNRDEMLENYAKYESLYYKARRQLKKTGAKKIHRARRRAERIKEITSFGIPEKKLTFVNHHQSHAATAYYGWGKKDEPVLVLTNDGGGDDICASVSIVENGKWNKLHEVSEAASIGNLYAMVTYYMGMVPLEHEYKLMGMAPYAPASGAEKVYNILRKFFRIDTLNDPLGWGLAEGMPETLYSYSYLRSSLERMRFDWIAAGMQRVCEEVLVDWVRRCVQHTGISKIALSGGVFMNVKANKLIMELDEVEDMYIFPSCGDETNAIGAAWQLFAEETGEFPEPVGPLYLGYEITAEEAEQAAEKYKDEFRVERPENPEERVAELIASGKVVARAFGRAEFGARALGNRSIIADPTVPEVIRIINEMIKSRDFWMPFAPVILDERADDYLVNPKKIPAPWMIMSYDTTEKQNEMLAAIHPYDRTARPQVITRPWNESYYDILKFFQERTGRGVLMNTSFNLHGFPIVNTAEDAIYVMKNSGLDILDLGPVILFKD